MSFRWPRSSCTGFSRFNVLTLPWLNDPQKLDRVAQLLQRDPKPVTLFLRQLAELPGALARSAPPALDEARSDIPDGREEQGRLLRCRLVAPPAGLEPSGKPQHSRRIALGLDPLLGELIGLPAPVLRDFC